MDGPIFTPLYSSSLAESIGRDNIIDYNSMPGYMETVMTDMMKGIQSKKDELVKQKLKEKGFGHLIDGMEKRLFPKVCSVRHKGWAYFFADDGTDDGCFIVAIQDFEFNQGSDGIEERINMNVSFKYQDKMSIKLNEL